MTVHKAPFIRRIRLDGLPGDPQDAYLADLAVVRHLRETPLELTSPVTILTGDNGAGKSTLLEAVAIASGFNSEGGTRHLRAVSDETVSGLGDYLIVSRPAKPHSGYFLRAETHYSIASAYRHLPDSPTADLHKMSHGESVMELLDERLTPHSLYLLDEPEAGLSVVRQMALLSHIAQSQEQGCQFILATHSPILMAIPGAQILEIDESGIAPVDFEDNGAVSDMREFFADVEGTVAYLTGA